MSKLKVRFIPEGGFEKNGAFIEYEGDEPSGDETAYQRQGYLTLNIACEDVKVVTHMEVVCEHEKAEDRKLLRVINANGKIQPARWGQFSLSFLGEKSNTHAIAVSIHESTVGESAYLSGVNWEADLDGEGLHYFFLELHVHRERFAPLLAELATPGAVLQISARSDRFGNFYAEWSPSISDGRVIKFLDSKRDVENSDEIPEHFWRTPEFQRELVSNAASPPVTISVGRPLHPLLSAPSPFEDYEDTDKDTRAPSFQPVSAPIPNPIPAIEELSKQLRRGAFWIGLWLALIFAILLLRA